MKLQDIFEADEPVQRKKPGPVAKPKTVVPAYDENGLSNTRWSLNHNSGSPLHSIRSNTKLGKQYREEHKALETQVNNQVKDAMKPYFEKYGYISRMNPSIPGHYPLGPGCYLEVDEAHKYQLGKGSRELIDAMSSVTGVRGTHRNFPNIDSQLYIYKFQVDGPNGIKLPAIAEMYVVYEEARTSRKAEGNTPARWAVWIPHIVVGDDVSLTGKTPEPPRPFG